MADIVELRCALGQSGNPVTFSAVGGGRVTLDFDDSQLGEAAALLVFRDVPLLVTFQVDDGGTMVATRHGGKREGAGRKSKVEQSEMHEDDE